MNRTINLLLGLYIALFFAPIVTQAGPIIRGGESVSIDAAQTLEGDFYGFGSIVTLSGIAEHDVYAAGGTVTVNAPVASDLTIAGGSIQIHSDIGDDLRVLGGEVTLGGNVKGDVAVVGGILTVLSTAQIDGDILFFGGSLVVEGDVSGSIHAYTETVRINANIAGDVTVTASTGLTLSNQARVGGDVTYKSLREISRAQDAVIEGNIQKIELDVSTSEGSFKSVFLFALALLFMAASLYVIARSKIERVVAEAFARPGQNGLIGLATFLGMPFVSIILFVSVVGVPLGLLAFIAYAGLIVLSFGLCTIVLGYGLQKLIRKNETLTIGTLVLGVAATILITAIPFIGFFTLFAIFLISVGSIGTLVVRFLRQ